jgi:phosphatidylglycerol---prolipoprotein diacylglyceryl transferase
MYPILFTIAGRPVYTYGVCVLLGLLVLLGVTFALARRTGWTLGRFSPIAAGAIFGAFVGARLSHLLVEPAKAAALLDFYSLFQTITPGNVVGLIVGGFLGGYLVRRSLGLPSIGNEFAFGLAGASVCWRVGCTCGGCCYGLPTDLPWAIHLDGANRHPTMAYDGLFNLLMLAVLWWARPYLRRDDTLLFFYIACYAVFRFWLEFLRLYPQVLFGLTGIQLLCLAIITWYAARWRHVGLAAPALGGQA